MTSRWLCPRCHILLGIFRDQILEIRYKAVAYIVTNPESVETTCRRCGERVKSS
jgi:RNase P subunit RPR2